MVKVTLEEENKAVEHEGECAFVCMTRPVKAPKGSNAVLCLVGEVSMIDLARAIAKCALEAFNIMAGGDESAKDAAIYALLSKIEAEAYNNDENPAKDTDIIPFPTKISRT